MSVLEQSPFCQFMGLEQPESSDGLKNDGLLVARFAEHHLGNPLIRSIHGGIVGTLLEVAAEYEVERHLRETGGPKPIELTGAAVNYLRVTKDADLFARAEIVRMGRRIAFVQSWCWQDEEALKVAYATCQVRILDQ